MPRNHTESKSRSCKVLQHPTLKQPSTLFCIFFSFLIFLTFYYIFLDFVLPFVGRRTLLNYTTRLRNFSFDFFQNFLLFFLCADFSFKLLEELTCLDIIAIGKLPQTDFRQANLKLLPQGINGVMKNMGNGCSV